MVFLRYEIVAMTTNPDIIIAAVSLIIKAALLAARFSGRVRKRSLKRPAVLVQRELDKRLLRLTLKLAFGKRFLKA